MNTFSNLYSSFFQIVKTTKDISEFKDKITDRLIITKSGKMYFDYSSEERIEISNISENYKTDITFNNYNINEVIKVSFNDISTVSGNIVNLADVPLTNVLLFDSSGNIGIVVNKDDISETCEVCILTKNLTAEELKNNMLISRYTF